jgi:Arc/MetJ-type ribon-helix-helix transcriptional regulator
MKMPKRLYTFAIDPDLDAGLKALKTKTGVSESETIRRALRRWLEEHGVMKAERKRASTRKRS